MNQVESSIALGLRIMEPSDACLPDAVKQQ